MATRTSRRGTAAPKNYFSEGSNEMDISPPTSTLSERDKTKPAAKKGRKTKNSKAAAKKSSPFSSSENMENQNSLSIQDEDDEDAFLREKERAEQEIENEMDEMDEDEEDTFHHENEQEESKSLSKELTKKNKSGAKSKKSKSSSLQSSQSSSSSAVVSGAEAGKPKRSEQITVDKAQHKGNSIFGHLLSSNKADFIIDTCVFKQLKNKKNATEVGIVNMVLCAAGSPQGKILPSDCPLGDMDAAEVHELMDEHLSDFDQQYALSLKKKLDGSTFRERYIEFFDNLGQRLLESTKITGANAKKSSGNELEVLKTLVDVFVSLSAEKLLGIRDAASEAASILGRRIVSSLVERRTEALNERRLLSAEENKGASSRKPTPRYTSLAKSIASIESIMKTLDKLTSTIFSGLVVNRYRDYYPVIRAATVSHVGKWIAIDGEKYLRDEYLKYIGWLLTDPSAQVRLAAVKALDYIMETHENSPHLQRFQGFIDRFADTLAYLATLDTDGHVNLETIVLLQKVDKEGLLDTISETTLDRIDRVVFDADAEDTCRAEALTFMMNHTEGFEVDDELDDSMSMDEMDEKPKSKSKKQSKLDEQRLTQRTAVQLETLCEFIELHIKDSSDFEEKALLLVDACLMMDDSRRNIVTSWPVMISLLLKESDDLVTSSLRPSIVHILQCLLVTSADILKAEITGTILSARDDKEKEEHWTGLRRCVKNDLNALLTRYRDSTDNMLLLVRLMEAVDSTDIEQKHLEALVDQAVEIFETTQKDSIADCIVKSFGKWRSDDESNTFVDSSLNEMLRRVWGKFQDSLSDVKRMQSSLDMDVDAEGGGSKIRSRGSAVLASDVSDERQKEMIGHAYTLSSCIGKILAYAKQVDVRAYLKRDASAEAIADDIVEATNVFLELRVFSSASDSAERDVAGSRKQVGRRSSSSSSQRGKSSNALELDTIISQGCQKSAELLFSLVMWNTRDVHLRVKLAVNREREERTQKRIEVDKEMRENIEEDKEKDEAMDEEKQGEAEDGLGLPAPFQAAPLTKEDRVRAAVSKLPSPSKAVEGVNFRGQELDDLNSDIDSVIFQREKLLDVLTTWLFLDSDGNTAEGARFSTESVSQMMAMKSTTSVQEVMRASECTIQLQRRAYQMVNDLRTLFPQRYGEQKYVDDLQLKLGDALKRGLRHVLQTEELRLHMLMKKADAVDGGSQDSSDATWVTSGVGTSRPKVHQPAEEIQAKVAEQQSIIASTLLSPLSQALIYDVANMDPLQAAVLLSYIVDPDPRIHDIAKVAAKRMKDSSVMAYMRAQITALKIAFQEHAHGPLRSLSQYEIEKAQEMRNVDALDIQDTLAAFNLGHERVEDLTTKLLYTLGISTDQYLRIGRRGQAATAISGFFTAGLDYAFKSKENNIFFDFLSRYIKFLTPNQKRHLTSNFELYMKSNENVTALMKRYENIGNDLGDVEYDDKYESSEGNGTLSDIDLLRAASLDSFYSAVRGEKVKDRALPRGGRKSVLKVPSAKGSKKGIPGCTKALAQLIYDYGAGLKDTKKKTKARGSRGGTRSTKPRGKKKASRKLDEDSEDEDEDEMSEEEQEPVEQEKKGGKRQRQQRQVATTKSYAPSQSQSQSPSYPSPGSIDREELSEEANQIWRTVASGGKKSDVFNAPNSTIRDISVEEDSPEERRSVSASVRSDAYDAHPALGMNLDEPVSSASSPGSPAYTERASSLGKRKSPEVEKIEESLTLPEPSDDFLNNAPSRRRFR